MCLVKGEERSLFDRCRICPARCKGLARCDRVEARWVEDFCMLSRPKIYLYYWSPARCQERSIFAEYQRHLVPVDFRVHFVHVFARMYECFQCTNQVVRVVRV